MRQTWWLPLWSYTLPGETDPEHRVVCVCDARSEREEQVVWTWRGLGLLWSVGPQAASLKKCCLSWGPKDEQGLARQKRAGNGVPGGGWGMCEDSKERAGGAQWGGCVRAREVRDEAGRRGGGRAAQPGAGGGSPQRCLALAWGPGWLSLGRQGSDFLHFSSNYHSSW